VLAAILARLGLLDPDALAPLLARVEPVTHDSNDRPVGRTEIVLA
jgi:hypothetical protein